LKSITDLSIPCIMIFSTAPISIISLS
jgi:hypothetical protein